uniref:Uncharacterized protein n=1 Tax=Oryza meridionalis TaxID=40149 RepID=A0A0E0CK59_9ORYZ
MVDCHNAKQFRMSLLEDQELAIHMAGISFQMKLSIIRQDKTNINLPLLELRNGGCKCCLNCSHSAMLSPRLFQAERSL